MSPFSAALAIFLSLSTITSANPLPAGGEPGAAGPSEGYEPEPPDFRKGEEPYRVTPPDSGDVNAQNFIGTWLYGYDGCKEKNSAYKDNIDDAYYDSWTMANTEGVSYDINWNEAAALEFLGAPGINKPKQKQIQSLFGNVATVIYSYKNPKWFQHHLRVRCDDPGKRCEKRPDQDPCNPNPPPSPPGGPKPKATPIAYATNKGGDGYPMINFCQGFFDQRSLSNAVAYGNGQRGLDKLRLKNYDNRAHTFFHELTHLDLAADSPKNNPRVLDMTIAIKLGDSGQSANFQAYGFLYPKILARYTEDVGLYVQQNAENLADFALAKYVMTKNGNIYPHLPLVKYDIDGPPWYSPPTLKASVANFLGEDGSVYLNVTDDGVTPSGDESDGRHGADCAYGPHTGASPTVIVDKLVPLSEYPASYQADVKSWLEELGAKQASS